MGDWFLLPEEAMWYRMSASSPKKAVALQLLERSSVFIHLDPRRQGVIVPRGFLNQAQLVLQIGFDMAVAIPDLDVGDEGISCTLSFNRQRHFCRMPWDSIFALIGQNGGGRVWREDVPVEVLEQRAAAEKAADSQRAKTRPSHLRAVPSADATPSATVEQSEGEDPSAGSSAQEPAVERVHYAEAGLRSASAPTEVAEPHVAADEVASAEQGALDDGSAVASSESSGSGNAPSRSAASGRNSGKARNRPPYLRLVE